MSARKRGTLKPTPLKPKHSVGSSSYVDILKSMEDHHRREKRNASRLVRTPSQVRASSMHPEKFDHALQPSHARAIGNSSIVTSSPLRLPSPNSSNTDKETKTFETTKDSFLFAMEHFKGVLRSQRSLFGQGIHSPAELFDAIVDQGATCLDLSGFQRCIDRLDFGFSFEQTEMIFYFLDPQKTGFVDRNDFIFAIKNPRGFISRNHPPKIQEVPTTRIKLKKKKPTSPKGPSNETLASENQQLRDQINEMSENHKREIRELLSTIDINKTKMWRHDRIVEELEEQLHEERQLRRAGEENLAVVVELRAEVATLTSIKHKYHDLQSRFEDCHLQLEKSQNELRTQTSALRQEYEEEREKLKHDARLQVAEATARHDYEIDQLQDEMKTLARNSQNKHDEEIDRLKADAKAAAEGLADVYEKEIERLKLESKSIVLRTNEAHERELQECKARAKRQHDKLVEQCESDIKALRKMSVDNLERCAKEKETALKELKQNMLMEQDHAQHLAATALENTASEHKEAIKSCEHSLDLTRKELSNVKRERDELLHDKAKLEMVSSSAQIDLEKAQDVFSHKEKNLESNLEVYRNEKFALQRSLDDTTRELKKWEDDFNRVTKLMHTNEREHDSNLQQMQAHLHKVLQEKNVLKQELENLVHSYHNTRTEVGNFQFHLENLNQSHVDAQSRQLEMKIHLKQLEEGLESSKTMLRRQQTEIQRYGQENDRLIRENSELERVSALQVEDKNSLDSELRSERDKCRKLNNKMFATIDALKEEHELNMAELKASHDAKLKALESTYENKINSKTLQLETTVDKYEHERARLVENHQEETAALHANYQNNNSKLTLQLEQLTGRNEQQRLELIKGHQAALVSLRTQRDELVSQHEEERSLLQKNYHTAVQDHAKHLEAVREAHNKELEVQKKEGEDSRQQYENKLNTLQAAFEKSKEQLACAERSQREQEMNLANVQTELGHTKDTLQSLHIESDKRLLEQTDIHAKSERRILKQEEEIGRLEELLSISHQNKSKAIAQLQTMATYSVIKIIVLNLAKTLARAFRRWHHKSEKHSFEELQQLQANRYEQRRLLERETRVHRATMRLKHQTIAKVFYTWGDAHRKQRRIRQLSNRLVYKWRHLKLTKLLNTWHDHVLQIKVHETMVGNAKSRAGFKITSRVLYKWKDFIASRIKLRQYVHRTCRRWTHRGLLRALQTWIKKTHVQKVSEIRNKHRTTSLRVQMAVIDERNFNDARIVFMRWKQIYLDGHKRRRLLHKACFKIRNRQFLCIFEKWSVYAGKVAKGRRLVARFVEHGVHKILYKRFYKWIEAAGSAKQDKEKMVRFVHRWKSGILAQGWRTWNDFVLLSKTTEAKQLQVSRDKAHRRSSISAVVQRAAANALKEKISQLFFAWKDMTKDRKRIIDESNRILRMYMGSKRDVLLISILHGWQRAACKLKMHRLNEQYKHDYEAFVQKMQETHERDNDNSVASSSKSAAQLFERFISHKLGLVVAKRFHQWVKSTVKSRTDVDKMHRFVRKWRTGILGQGWRSWKDFARQKRLELLESERKSAIMASRKANISAVNSVVHRAAMASIKHDLARVFYAWSDKTKESKRIGSLGSRMVRIFMGNREDAIAINVLHKWHQQVLKDKAERERQAFKTSFEESIKKLKADHERMTASIHKTSEVQYMAIHESHETKQEKLIDRICYLCQDKKTSLYFHAWRINVVVGKHKRRLLEMEEEFGVLIIRAEERGWEESRASVLQYFGEDVHLEDKVEIAMSESPFSRSTLPAPVASMASSAPLLALQNRHHDINQASPRPPFVSPLRARRE